MAAEDAHEAHAQVALVYLMIAMVIGAFVAHLLSRIAPWLPYTPTLLIIGILESIANQHAGNAVSKNHIVPSLHAWENIDGHLLLFVFLPPLLFADSMHLQVNLVRRCLWQCTLLAGPGVVMGALLNGLFARYILPYDWDWPLCWSYGAVQAATDPVAVVALLNQLGASPSLTMIISGESLLNDGSAIVVWSFFFGQLKGETRDLVTFLITLICGGVGIGIAFGLVTLYWLSLLSRKHDHNDITIQVALTIFACYACFYMAEGVFAVRGATPEKR